MLHIYFTSGKSVTHSTTDNIEASCVHAAQCAGCLDYEDVWYNIRAAIDGDEDAQSVVEGWFLSSNKIAEFENDDSGEEAAYYEELNAGYAQDRI